MNWKALSGAVQGTSHRRSGTPCQDAVGVTVTNGVFIGTVSDGAGSAAMAEVGSRIVAEAAARFFLTRSENGREVDPRLVCIDLVNTLRLRIKAEALLDDRSIRDYHATLLLALVVPYGLLAAQVGDGFICARDRSSNIYRTVCTAAKGEYRNQTAFVTLTDALDHMSVTWKPGRWDFVCLASDGLEPISIDRRTRRPGQDFFRALEDDIRRNPGYRDSEIAEWLDSSAVNSRCDDDKSVVVAVAQE